MEIYNDAVVEIGGEQIAIQQVQIERATIHQQNPRPPAEYLSDEKGLYGIRINCVGIPMEVCLRPDKLIHFYHMQCWLHPTPRKTKESSLEGQMVSRLAIAIRERKYPHLIEFLLTKKTKDMSKEDRRRWYAVDWYSARIINGMWKRLLKEAADQEALKLARRFHISYRMQVYKAACQSLRAKQLFEAFPLLGVKIYENRYSTNLWGPEVEAGKKLKDLADAFGVPFVLRKVKPGAVHGCAIALEWSTFRNNPDFVHAYLPKQTMRQWRWLVVLSTQNNDGHAGAGQWKTWLAKHVPTGPKLRPIIEDVQLIRDWFLSQPEPPTCSWEVAKKRSEEWHATAAERFAREAAVADARRQEELKRPLPEPWIVGVTLEDGIEILPLTTGEMLLEEGTRMHHCVGGYDSYVKQGTSYIYSVRKNGKSIATFELVKSKPVMHYVMPPPMPLNYYDALEMKDMVIEQAIVYEYGISQIQGPCNSAVPTSVYKLVNNWLKVGNELCQRKIVSSTQLSASDADSLLVSQLAPMLPPGLPEL